MLYLLQDSFMHPTVRVVSFLVLAGFLSAGGSARLGVAALLLALAYGLSGAPHLIGFWRALKRLRFLWLSLAVLYLWFTPGEALWTSLGIWSPTLQGVTEGAMRVGVLVLMVAAAQLLLQSTATPQLVAAVHWLSWPLQWLGLDRDRFALRLVLVLETVPRLGAAQVAPQPVQPAPRGRFSKHVALLGSRLRGALAAAAAAPARQIELPAAAAPAAWQWLYPIAIAAVMAAAGLR